MPTLVITVQLFSGMSRESKTSMPFVSKHCVQMSVDKSKYANSCLARINAVCGIVVPVSPLEHSISFCDVRYKFKYEIYQCFLRAAVRDSTHD